MPGGDQADEVVAFECEGCTFESSPPPVSLFDRPRLAAAPSLKMMCTIDPAIPKVNDRKQPDPSSRKSIEK